MPGLHAGFPGEGAAGAASARLAKSFAIAEPVHPGGAPADCWVGRRTNGRKASDCLALKVDGLCWHDRLRPAPADSVLPPLTQAGSPSQLGWVEARHSHVPVSFLLVAGYD